MGGRTGSVSTDLECMTLNLDFKVTGYHRCRRRIVCAADARSVCNLSFCIHTQAFRFTMSRLINRVRLSVGRPL